MEWEQFSAVFAQIGPPLAAAQDALAASLMGWVRPWLQGGVLLYLVGLLLWRAIKGRGDPLTEAEEVLVTGAVAVTFATSAAWFGPYVRDLVLVDWIQGISARIAGISAGGTLSAAMFDAAWNKAWVAGLAFYKNIPWSMAGLGLLAILIIFWAAAAAATVLGFVVWLKATVLATVLLGFGPLFVGLFAFPWTRRWFWGWVNTLASNVVLSLLAFGMVALLLTAQTRVITLILVDVQTNTGRGFLGLQSAANEFNQAKMLFGGAIIYLVCGWVALQLPGTAASITHGFAGYGNLAVGLPGLGNLAGRGADTNGGGGSGDTSSAHAAPPPSAPAAPAPVAHPPPPGPSLSNPGGIARAAGHALGHAAGRAKDAAVFILRPP